MTKDYQLWPPEYQRKMVIKTAARSRAFFNIMADNGSAVTDPQKDFVRFLKDITRAMVGNKGCEHGAILMKALSHFGMVRVPRDRVKQIFTGKRGRQYTVIREEFMLEDDQGAHARFAYRETMVTSSTKITSKWCSEMTSLMSWATPMPQLRNAVTWSRCG